MTWNYDNIMGRHTYDIRCGIKRKCIPIAGVSAEIHAAQKPDRETLMEVARQHHRDWLDGLLRKGDEK